MRTRRVWFRRRPLIGAVMLLAASPSCVLDRSGADPLPPPPVRLDIALTEYRFDFVPPAGIGRVVVRAVNRGTLEHSLTLIVIPDDFPPLDEQLRGDVRRGATTLATVRRRGPGATGTFAVDLVPGRYGLICFVTDADGMPHALKGMNAEFRVS